MQSAFLKTLNAVARKEWIHVRRDRSALMAALVAPILQVSLFGLVDMRVRDVPTIVVDQDGSVHSRLLLDQLQATKLFDLRGVTVDERAARAEIAAGKARVAIVIPKAFRDNLARDTEGHVGVLVDGSDSTLSAQVLAAVNGLAASRTLDAYRASTGPRREAGPGALAVHPLLLFNPDGRTARFLVPGLLAIVLQLVAVVQAATSIVRERERGTLEQLLMTPISASGLIVGKLAPYLALGVADTLLLLGLMHVLGVAVQGSFVLLMLAIVVYLLALLCLGLWVSLTSRSLQEAQDSAQMLFLPAFFLSGFMFPLNGLPRPLAWIAEVLPVTHMIELLRGVILRGASVSELAPRFAALVGLTSLLLFIVVRKARSISLL
jgi:ABC-type multidrug transport system permease subunit